MKTSTLLALAALVCTGAVQADPAALQRCRIIPEAAARLACYDAIALPGIGSRAGWGAPTTSAPAAPAAPAALATAPGVAATAVPADPSSTFGLEARIVAAGPDRMESRLIGKVQDLPAGTRFTLENGQVWQSTEYTGGYYDLTNPKVVISRGALGSFFITFEGANATPRVRRVK